MIDWLTELLTDRLLQEGTKKQTNEQTNKQMTMACKCIVLELNKPFVIRFGHQITLSIVSCYRCILLEWTRLDRTRLDRTRLAEFHSDWIDDDSLEYWYHHLTISQLTKHLLHVATRILMGFLLISHWLRMSVLHLDLFKSLKVKDLVSSS